MPVPVTSVRVAPANRDVVQQVVRLLNGGRAAWCAETTTVTSRPSSLAS